MKYAEKSCCFIGHRTIEGARQLKQLAIQVIEDLIADYGVTQFLFGSKSAFNALCYEAVTHLKEKYPQLERIYVRAEFPCISASYERYLLDRYEKTCYPDEIAGAGKGVYVKRNRSMIERSDFCVFYYDEAYTPQKRKSGTKLAYAYAVKKQKKIINLRTAR